MAKTNTCEGTPGQAVTTANSALPDAWQTVVGTVAYAGEHPAHGSAGLRLTTGSTPSKSYVQWSTDGAQEQYVRLNWFFEQVPAGNHRLVQFANAQGSCMDLELRTDRTIRVRDAYGRLQHQTQPLDLGQTYRIELYGRFFEGPGVCRLRIYDAADSMTTVDTFDNQSDGTFRGTPTLIRFGAIDDVSTASLWMDDLGLSSSGFLGPVQPQPQPPLVEGIYAQANYGDPITLTLAVTDPEGGALTYVWSIVEAPGAVLGPSNLFVDASGPIATVTAYADAGVGVVRCTVTDPSGLSTAVDNVVEFLNDMTTGTGPAKVAMPVVGGGFGSAPFGALPFGY